MKHLLKSWGEEHVSLGPTASSASGKSGQLYHSSRPQKSISVWALLAL